jgi:hypothetical protein
VEGEDCLPLTIRLKAGPTALVELVGEGDGQREQARENDHEYPRAIAIPPRVGTYRCCGQCQGGFDCIRIENNNGIRIRFGPDGPKKIR